MRKKSGPAKTSDARNSRRYLVASAACPADAVAVSPASHNSAV